MGKTEEDEDIGPLDVSDLDIYERSDDSITESTQEKIDIYYQKNNNFLFNLYVYGF